MVSFTAPDDLCIDAGVQMALGGGSPTGGTYSGTGVTDDGNGQTYSFDPAASGIGIHTINYTVQVGELTVIVDNDIALDEIDGARRSDDDDAAYVADDFIPAESGTLNSVSWSGVYSPLGPTPVQDDFTISIYSDAGGSVGDLLYSEAVGDAVNRVEEIESFSGFDIFSYSVTIDFTVTASTTYWLVIYNRTADGWFWSSKDTPTGSGLFSSDLSNWTQPVSAEYDFTLTLNAPICEVTATDDIEILALPEVTFNAPDDLCEDEGIQQNLLGGEPFGGMYSGPGVSDNGDGTFDFDPAAAGVGIQTITYSFTGVGAPVQLGEDLPAQGNGDVYGSSVAFSADGNRVAFGGFLNDDGGNDAGHVQVFDWDGTNWIQAGIDLDGTSSADLFGFDIALSEDGTILAVGAPGPQGQLFVPDGVGFVRVHSWNGTAWLPLGQDLTGDMIGDGVGKSVSLSADGTRVAFAAAGAAGIGSDNEFVRVFEYDGSAWVQVGLDILGAANNDALGDGLDLSSDGNRLAIGSSRHGNDRGRTQIFEWNGTAWLQLGADIIGAADGDFSGEQVAISANGDRVAISATRNADNGNNAGQVRVFDWNGTTWVQAGQDIDGDGNNSQVGSDVAISADGNRIAVGSLDDNGSFSGAGKVRIYDWDGTDWIPLADDIDGQTSAENFGSALALSNAGERLAVGAPFFSVTNGVGRVYDIDPELCTNTATDEVEVFPLPVVTFSTENSFCEDQGPLTLGGGLPEGGVYSGTGVTNNGNGQDFTFDPSAVGPGLYPVTYTFVDQVTACSGTATVDLEVLALPELSFTAPDDLCIDAGIQEELGGGTPIGGTYSGPGVTDDGNGLTYSFDPAVAGNGTQTITYSLTSMFNQLGEDLDGEFAGDNFGAAVAISEDGNVVAISGDRNPGGTAGLAGHVRVFAWDGTTWNQRGDDIDGVNSLDLLGRSIALSADGNRLAVGIIGHDITADADNAGQVKVFDWNGSTWVQVGQDINGAEGDFLGISVGITPDGNRLVVGADQTPSNGPGYVRIFDLLGGVWTQLGADIDGDSAGDEFGTSVAVSDDGIRVAIGAPDDTEGGTFAGSVKVFDWDGNNWGLAGQKFLGAENDLVGISVALSAEGSRLAIGANYNSDGGFIAGQVKIYDFDGTNWMQVGDEINGASRAEFFGGRVDLTPDGNRVAIGASQAEDGNEDDRGAVKIYDFDGTDWVLFDMPILGEAIDDGDGDEEITTAISADGTRLIMGATKNDGNGDAAGHARIFSLQSISCTNTVTDEVEVFSLPDVTFADLAPVCSNAGIQTALGGGLPEGGVYSGTGVTDDGNGTTFTFDPSDSGAGTYEITYSYTDPTTDCSNFATVEITVNEPPVVTLTAGDIICIDQEPAILGGGLPEGGVYSGPGVTDNGDGLTYTFDPQTTGEGTQTITYTFTDGNACTNAATGALIVSACDVQITDPCSCKNNATSLVNGQFDERIEVSAAPAGETWTVVAVNGLFDPSSLAPPSAPTPIAIGTELTEVLSTTPGASNYQLSGIHVDGIGYAITVSNGSETLSISNRCWYPNPSFENLANAYCRSSRPLVLAASAQLGDGTGPATPEQETFLVINAETNEVILNEAAGNAILNFQTLPAGRYRVIYTFDAADGVPDGSHPGCSQSIEREFELLEADCGQFPWGGR
ncbi:MAG: hypothetical protein AAF828_10110 [Bacteroidota bacterium]